MKHAYLIIAHNEWPVLQTLLEMLDDTSNDIFVHIDLRASLLFKQIQSVHIQKAKLHVLSQRIPVYWGDISQVEVEYRLLETALKNGCDLPQGGYDYYHLLSGVDLPIQSQSTIQRFFEEHKGKEFVSFWHTAGHRKDLKRKISRFYFFTKHRRPGEKWHKLTTPLFNLALIIQKGLCIRRKQEVDFQKGSQWFSITHAFAQYLIQQKEWALKRLKHTLCPDEIFVQTVLWNSPFQPHIYRSNEDDAGNLRRIDWKRGRPYVWRNEDFEELVQAEQLFARKFSSQQTLIIQKLKEKYIPNPS